MLTASVELPGQVGSSAAARRFVVTQLAEWTYLGSVDDVLIVATELVNNAVRYTHGGVLLRLSLSEGCLRLEVGDDSSAVPAPRQPGPDGGFGLHVVEKICTNWGVELLNQGKIVWCECLRPGDQPRPEPTGEAPLTDR
jgi:hypothetical protein